MTQHTEQQSYDYLEELGDQYAPPTERDCPWCYGPMTFHSGVWVCADCADHAARPPIDRSQ